MPKGVMIIGCFFED